MAENIVLGVYLVLPLLLWRGVYIIFIKQRWHRRERRSGWVLLAGNALVLAAVLSSLMPVGEIYYRFIYDTTDTFAFARVTDDWFDRHYRFNSSGVRDSMERYSQKRTARMRRITFLGDSFTVGHGVADVEDRFANLIRQAQPTWEVHVLAQNGRDIDEHIDGLRRSIDRGYELDVVVLVYCLNDIADLIEPWQKKMTALHDRPPPPFPIRQSYLLDTLYHRWKIAADPELRDYYGFVTDAYDDVHWRVQQARLRKLRDIVTFGGGRFVVVTFPFMHQLGPDSPFRGVHQKLDAFWTHLGTPQLDLLPIFAPHTSNTLVVNRRDPHPNEKAHALAAAAVEKFVEKQLR